MDLLQSFLKKNPKSRISASEALEHNAFDFLKKEQAVENIQTPEINGVQNMKDFHEK